jgi:prevent-host-death family protein
MFLRCFEISASDSPACFFVLAVIEWLPLRSATWRRNFPQKIGGFDRSDLSDHIASGFFMKNQDIGTLEAKTRLSEILSEVEQGRHFYITRHGKRVAELTPIKRERKKPKFGCGKGVFTHIAADFDGPLDDFREYME